MRDFLIPLVHLIVTFTRVAGPSGLRSIVAESALVRHQLLVLHRPFHASGTRFRVAQRTVSCAFSTETGTRFARAFLA